MTIRSLTNEELGGTKSSIEFSVFEIKDNTTFIIS